MSDIAASDITVTQDFPQEIFGLPMGHSLMLPTLTFGNGSLTYPTYGVPVPALKEFRLSSGIDRIHITPRVGTYMWIYDPTVRTASPVAPNGTLRAYALATGSEMSGAITSNTKLDLMILGS